MKPFALALAFLALLVLAVAGYGDRAARAAPDGKTGLKLVFSDDFGGTGAPDASKWSLYDGPGHNGNGLRCPEAFSQADGVLTVTAQMKRVTGCGQAPNAANPPTLVSGGMRALGEWRYVRVVARVRVDPDPSGATSGVLIMWPKSCIRANVRTCGEMDYWETGLDRDRRPVKAFMHYGFDRGLDLQRRFVLSDVAGNPLDGTAWHEVQLDWLDYGSGVMAVSVDGRLVAVGLDDVDCSYNVCDWITAAKKHPTIQLDAFKTAMGNPVKMQVDYIRVYREGR